MYQLCPKCEIGLDFGSEGWWRCPGCNTSFYVKETDHENEDCHCYLPGTIKESRVVPRTDVIPVAQKPKPKYRSIAELHAREGIEVCRETGRILNPEKMGIPSPHDAIKRSNR